MDIRDIKILAEPLFASPLLLSVWALALLSFGVSASILLRGGKKKAAPLPPYESASQALTALERENLLPQGEIIQYYTKLSAIVRNYLEGACRIEATTRTTEELLSRIGDTGILPPLSAGRLRDFLTRCDLVKFAGHVPSPEERAAILPAAREIIEEIKGAAADEIS